MPLSLVFPHGTSGKEPALWEMEEMQVPSLEDPLEEGMATHSSVLAWRIPWTEESGWLQGRTELDTTERLSTKAHTQPYLWLQSLVGVGHTYSITLDIYTETLCWI